MTETLKFTEPNEAGSSEMVPEPSFEAGLKELEDIVTKMEAGQVSLDEAVKLYERGMLLQKRCQKQLEDARLRIEKIAVSHEGELTLEPFEDMDTSAGS